MADTACGHKVTDNPKLARLKDGTCARARRAPCMHAALWSVMSSQSAGWHGLHVRTLVCGICVHVTLTFKNKLLPPASSDLRLSGEKKLCVCQFVILHL